jgi:hypothetical protein
MVFALIALFDHFQPFLVRVPREGLFLPCFFLFVHLLLLRLLPSILPPMMILLEDMF